MSEQDQIKALAELDGFFMRATKLEPTIKRSRAAELLDKTPRTLARYEAAGLLTPIKLNCRSVVYFEWQVRKLLNGQVQAGPNRAPSPAVARTGQGTFSPAAK